MSSIFDKSIACYKQIEKLFNATGELIEIIEDDHLGIHDLVFTSDLYRRAHISIVDARETKKVWMLHATVFPHINDGSPIYGFDIVAGPSKVSGAFHDFSSGGLPDHHLNKWFENITKSLEWNKKRELPEWAKAIFSNNIVAIGAVGESELDSFTNLGLSTLDYYLDHVGKIEKVGSDYTEIQNRYCYHQRQNPHTPKVLVNLGFSEEYSKIFVEENLFPVIC